MAKWYPAERPKSKGSGKYPGVRYREHKTRKMDAINLDRYFAITYWWQSKTHTEGIGWASEGHRAEEAANLLAQLKQNQKNGSGPCTLTDLRGDADRKRKTHEQEQLRQAKLDISFAEYFNTHYLPEISHANKPETVEKTVSHVRRWIGPVVTGIPIREISLSHCKKLKSNMLKADLSPRSIQYIFTSFEAIWRAAQDDGFVVANAPSKLRSFRKTLPKVDNRRERFLTYDEESRLLENLKVKSQVVHDMAVVSIDTGLRWSEITSLTWDRVDLNEKVFHLTRTKSGNSRWVPFTNRVKDILQGIATSEAGEYVFKNRWGNKVAKLSHSFSRAVNEIGLNNGVTDTKMKISFHSLRHTFASRVLKAGASIYEASRLLGHGSVVVTERYSHVVQEDLKSAVRRLESLRENEDNQGKVIPLRISGKR